MDDDAASHGGRGWRSQGQNAAYLMLNGVAGAAAGLLFWMLFARWSGLPPSAVGVGYGVVALATLAAVLAKGGLDTAVLRCVPGASSQAAGRVVRFAIVLGGSLAAALVAILAVAAHGSAAFAAFDDTAWFLAGLTAVALVVTWLQDAYFLAEGDARLAFQRNLVLCVVRIALPLPLVWLAAPQPVALAWALALVASVLAAWAFTRHIPERAGRSVPRREVVASALRNVSGSAAEFLPGLILVPIVLALRGPAAAAYFGMAWTAASLLFLAAAAISRSALSEMVRGGPGTTTVAVRRAARHMLFVVVPAAVLAAASSTPLLQLFGPPYAAAAPALAVLAASVVFVGPTYLYLAVLRARERSTALVVLPLLMILALALAVPPMASRFGLAGVAWAWLLANAPFGIYAALRLWSSHPEVSRLAPAPHVGGRAHME
ncbi:MAG: hypothetical protein V4510_02445 [bacterium]